MILGKFCSISHRIPDSMAGCTKHRFLEFGSEKISERGKINHKKTHSSETLFVNYSEIMLPKPQAMYVKVMGILITFSWFYCRNHTKFEDLIFINNQ